MMSSSIPIPSLLAIHPSLLLPASISNGAKTSTSHFPSRLHDMLNNACSIETNDKQIIGWCSDGRSFIIHGSPKDMIPLLAKHFRQTKYKSFLRQLQAYGFVRIIKGRNKGLVYHPDFQRGRKSLCIKMRRKVSASFAVQAAAAAAAAAASRAAVASTGTTHTSLSPLSSLVKLPSYSHQHQHQHQHHSIFHDRHLLPNTSINETTGVNMNENNSGKTTPGAPLLLTSSQQQDQLLPYLLNNKSTTTKGNSHDVHHPHQENYFTACSGNSSSFSSINSTNNNSMIMDALRVEIGCPLSSSNAVSNNLDHGSLTYAQDQDFTRGVEDNNHDVVARTERQTRQHHHHHHQHDVLNERQRRRYSTSEIRRTAFLEDNISSLLSASAPSMKRDEVYIGTCFKKNAQFPLLPKKTNTTATIISNHQNKNQLFFSNNSNTIMNSCFEEEFQQQQQQQQQQHQQRVNQLGQLEILSQPPTTLQFVHNHNGYHNSNSLRLGELNMSLTTMTTTTTTTTTTSTGDTLKTCDDSYNNHDRYTCTQNDDDTITPNLGSSNNIKMSSSDIDTTTTNYKDFDKMISLLNNNNTYISSSPFEPTPIRSIPNSTHYSSLPTPRIMSSQQDQDQDNNNNIEFPINSITDHTIPSKQIFSCSSSITTNTGGSYDDDDDDGGDGGGCEGTLSFSTNDFAGNYKEVSDDIDKGITNTANGSERPRTVPGHQIREIYGFGHDTCWRRYIPVEQGRSGDGP